MAIAFVLTERKPPYSVNIMIFMELNPQKL